MNLLSVIRKDRQKERTVRRVTGGEKKLNKNAVYVFPQLISHSLGHCLCTQHGNPEQERRMLLQRKMLIKTSQATHACLSNACFCRRERI